MTEMQDLERRLKAANERLAITIRAMAPKHKGGEQEEYRAACHEVLGLERRLAAAKGEEYAEPLEFPVRWDTGAPLPHLFVSDNRALLAFLLSEPDPSRDGSYVTIKDPKGREAEPLALVEFQHCMSAKLGDPNDEVFRGHPLNGRGLEPYTAQNVVNSHWIKELEAINSIHAMYRPESWRHLHHYVLWFHDSTFECVARSFRVETYRESWKELFVRMVDRLIQ